MGITALHESLATLLEVGIDSIEEHVLDLNDRLIAELGPLGMKAYVDGERGSRAGIVSVKVSNADAYIARLAESKIQVAVRQGLIRVSPHFYNTEEEILELVDNLKQM